jgi:hypothetical protein
MKIRIAIFLQLLVVSIFAKDIVIFQKDIRYNYRIELLKIALEKGDPSKQYNIVYYPHKVNFKRGLKLIEDGKVDVGSAFIDSNMVNRFYIIDYPILQGILGYRISFINAKKKKKWENQLTPKMIIRDFKAGFVEEWRDYKILEENGIEIVGTNSYTNLFPMLDYNRFDYFPRGINEIWNEYDKFSTEFPSLFIEENYSFYYPFPVNFFVNLDDPTLAKIIEKGLEIADKDGSLKKLFWRFHKDDLLRSKLNQRTIIRFKNSNRINDIPADKEQWWLKRLDEILENTSN